MIERLEHELAKYNEIQTSKRNEYRKKTNARKSEGGEAETADNMDTDKGAKASGELRSAKRAKGEGGEIMEGDTMEDVDMDAPEEEDQEDEAEEAEEEEEDGGDETEEEEQNTLDEDKIEEQPAHVQGDASDDDSD